MVEYGVHSAKSAGRSPNNTMTLQVGAMVSVLSSSDYFQISYSATQLIVGRAGDAYPGDGPHGEFTTWQGHRRTVKNCLGPPTTEPSPLHLPNAPPKPPAARTDRLQDHNIAHPIYSHLLHPFRITSILSSRSLLHLVQRPSQ
jgi:hypothetical protein